MKKLPLNLIILSIVSLLHLSLVVVAFFTAIPIEKKSDPILIRSITLGTTPQLVVNKNLIASAKAKAPASKKAITQKKVEPVSKAVTLKKSLDLDQLTVPTLDTKVKKVEKKESKLSFQEALADLENLLVLPKKGIAKISITITIEGQISDLDFIDCQDDENRSYLLDTLKGYKLAVSEKLTQEKQIILNLKGV